MRIKRMALLAGMALAAIALVAPATASASGMWTHNHKKLPSTENKTIELSGNVSTFYPSIGTYGCGVNVEATLTGHWGGETEDVKTGTGHLNKLEFITDTCSGTGLLSGCVPKSDSVKNLPWMLTAKRTDFEAVGTMGITFEFLPGCFIAKSESTFSALTFNPDDPKTMSEVEVSGEGTTHVFGMEVPVFAGGTLVFKEAGTYGVRERDKKETEEEHEEVTEEEEI